eukprot:UN14976
MGEIAQLAMYVDDAKKESAPMARFKYAFETFHIGTTHRIHRPEEPPNKVIFCNISDFLLKKYSSTTTESHAKVVKILLDSEVFGDNKQLCTIISEFSVDVLPSDFKDLYEYGNR